MADSPIYEISRDDDIVQIEFLQSPEKDDLVALMEELEQMPDSSLRLYLMIKAEILLSTAEVRNGADIARSRQNQPSKIAVVAPGNITYGISRIFKVFRESESTEFAVFRELEEARDWLRS
ncbi:MAG: hypothetical protein QNI86_14140 [Halieaceae bacterium]|nr:hypothetical protein [Halieaceae bacterium]